MKQPLLKVTGLMIQSLSTNLCRSFPDEIHESSFCTEVKAGCLCLKETACMGIASSHVGQAVSKTTADACSSHLNCLRQFATVSRKNLKHNIALRCHYMPTYVFSCPTPSWVHKRSKQNSSSGMAGNGMSFCSSLA